MSKTVVDISGMAVSNDPDDVLITYALGSCLGITVYDPEVKVGGMIHCMLPLSSTNKIKAKERPCMFVDTGMVLLLNKLFKMGLNKSRAVIKVAGGSQLLDKNGTFNIGQRNVTVFRKIMWKNAMIIKAMDVGGEISRTVSLDINSGQFLVKSNGKENVI